MATVVLGCTTRLSAEHDFWHLVLTFFGCVLFGAFVYLPLRLGVVAATFRSGLLPGLLRFAHGLVVFVGTAALFLLLLARLVIYLLALVFQVAG